MVLMQSHVADAQTSSMKWKVSVGMGFSSSEAMNLGFAQGAQISYKARAFELGLSVHHACSQTLSGTKRHGLGSLLKGKEASVQLSQATQDTRQEQNSANTSSIDLFAGVDVMRFLPVDARQSLTIGVLGGMGVSDSSFMLNNPEGMTIDLRYGGLWNYGVRGSYEYMLTERVGVGLSATYNVPQQNFYGLTNMVVRF